MALSCFHHDCYQSIDVLRLASARESKAIMCVAVVDVDRRCTRGESLSDRMWIVGGS